MTTSTLKKLSPLLLLSLLSFPVKAQTNVSGFISANTTWTTTGSPYIIVGNTLLSTSYTLRIDPGVVVKFDPSTVLQIDGTLLAIGAYDSRITFTSNQPSPAAGDWGEIHFSDTCVDAVFDTSGRYLSGCTMQYCDVLYGGSLGISEIHIENSSPYLSHCSILNSSNAGIYCNSSTFILDTSAVKNCSTYGLSFNDYFLNSCELLIRSDTIENNSNSGIYLTQNNFGGCDTNGRTMITDNYFISNKKGAIQAVLSFGLSVSKNYFTNNAGGVILLTEGEENVTIECNFFLNNKSTSYGAIWIPGGDGAANGIIANNVFDGNSSISGPSVATIQTNYTLELHFTNNIIKNNSSTTGTCCYFNPYNVLNIPYIYIDHNQFENNTGSSILYIDGSLGDLNSTKIIYMKYNDFLDNNPIEVYNNVPFGASDIYADSNYWGTTDTQHIESVIYDFFNYGDLSVVYYEPILTSPAVIDTSCSGGIPTAIKIITQPISTTAFPNPFSNSTEVKFGKALQDAEVDIYNVFGQRVRSIEHFSGNEISINRGNLSSGIYIYEIVEKQAMVANGKLVIE